MNSNPILETIATGWRSSNKLKHEIMKFKTSMLEYCKMILTKMSFSRILFAKEYRKSLVLLPRNERNEITQWVKANFKFRTGDQQGMR